MIGPDQFREFVQPNLREQCRWFDYSLFHLDGVDVIRHLDALMEIDELTALQWTAGAGKPDGGDPCWYELYDKVRRAGKSLHISVYNGSSEEIWNKCEALVKRYGCNGIYLLIPDMPVSVAREFLTKAEREWT